MNLPFIQYLSDLGDGTGTVQQNANFSAVSKLFYIQPPVGVAYSIFRVLFAITDGSFAVPTNYASGAALPNGLQVESRIDGVVMDSLDGNRIKRNCDWLTLADVSEFVYSPTASTLLLSATFVPQYGLPLQLNGDHADYFGIRVHDNLAALTAQVATAFGTQIK